MSAAASARSWGQVKPWGFGAKSWQLHGRAEILDWTDEQGTTIFQRFWMGRRILSAYEQSRRQGETRVCFLKITLDPVIRTYAVGYSVWEMRRRMESAMAKILIPAEHQAAQVEVADATTSSAP